jgi:hypothetical protein
MHPLRFGIELSFATVAGCARMPHCVSQAHVSTEAVQFCRNRPIVNTARHYSFFPFFFLLPMLFHAAWFKDWFPTFIFAEVIHSKVTSYSKYCRCKEVATISHSFQNHYCR